MRKQKLNKTLILMGTALVTLGLCGCVPFEENWNTEPADMAEAVEMDVQAESVDIPVVPCENCDVSDDFLVNQFSQTSETDDSYALTDKDILSLSKPVGFGKTSVKEKQVQAMEESMESKVVYTSIPVPEKTTITKTTTNVVMKTGNPVEAKTMEEVKTTKEDVKEVKKIDIKTDVKESVDVKEEVKAEENIKEIEKGDIKAEVKEPTNVKEDVKQVETSKTEVKEDVKLEEGAVAVKPISESKSDMQDNVVSEMVEHQTTSAVSGKITKGVVATIPLKKTVTTITETTTKVKQEKKVVKEPKTLAERVEYGAEVQEWEAYSGSTLRGLLMQWGSKAGWTVVWKLDRDYHLEAGVVFQGTFTDISSALIRSFARATPAPIGTFYKGNRVLVITTQEDENER